MCIRDRVYTSCSIGIAMYPEHGDDLDSVVRSADIAMYVAKEAGRHTYRVFQPEMDRRNADYVWLDTNLRKALAEGHLMLYYQPKLAGRGGEVDGVEAVSYTHLDVYKRQSRNTGRARRNGW